MRAFGRGLAGRQEPAPELGRAPRLGIALGGGFARGMSHIGVLKVLEEEGIKVDYVAGTSVGAVIGAAYCSGMSPKEMEEVACVVRFRDLARWTLSRYGFCSNDRMIGFLDKVLKAKSFEDLRIPLAVSATDINTGEGVVFRSGSLVDAVRASCAYPGMFLPVQVNGRLLVDGMLAHTVPAVPLKEMGAERVLAVHLSGHWASKDGPRHLFEVVGQCFSIAQANMCGTWKAAADHIIEPDVTGFAYDAFERSPEMIVRGEAAMRAALPAVRAWLAAAEPQRRPASSSAALPAPVQVAPAK